MRGKDHLGDKDHLSGKDQLSRVFWLEIVSQPTRTIRLWYSVRDWEGSCPLISRPAVPLAPASRTIIPRAKCGVQSMLPSTINARRQYHSPRSSALISPQTETQDLRFRTRPPQQDRPARRIQDRKAAVTRKRPEVSDRSLIGYTGFPGQGTLVSFFGTHGLVDWYELITSFFAFRAYI